MKTPKLAHVSVAHVTLNAGPKNPKGVFTCRAALNTDEVPIAVRIVDASSYAASGDLLNEREAANIKAAGYWWSDANPAFEAAMKAMSADL